VAAAPEESVNVHPAVRAALERWSLPPRRVAHLGIALGLLATWLALPPLRSRVPLWPVLVGVLAVACGIWAVTRDARRPGWAAVAAGLAGIAGGVLATRSSTEHLDSVFAWGALLAATLRFATPLTFAALGGLFSERSGVVNIALEGMMLTGAFFGVWGADVTGSWALGLLIAIASGAALGLVHAVFSIHVRTDQVVGGTAINFLALGITGYLFVRIYGTQGTPAGVPQVPDVRLGWLGSVPPHTLGSFLEESIGQLNLLIWLSFGLIAVAYVVIFRTPAGLRLRAAGEHPGAAEAVGVSVYAVRYAGVVLSGVLAALGGAYLSIGFVHTFNQNMTEGQGFIGLAALIFGRWRPLGAFAAAMLFGFSSALAFELPVYSPSGAVLFQALPYVLTLVAVVGLIGRSVPPASLGKPYVKQ
jgi:simple sugar transport system permease protein